MPMLMASWLKTPANPLRDVGAISIKYNGAAPEFIPKVFCFVFFKQHVHGSYRHHINSLSQSYCVVLLEWMLFSFL